jgi:hypothetical protein
VWVEDGGWVCHEAFEVCTPAKVGYAFSGDVGGLEDEVVEDDHEKVVADRYSLINHKYIEGDRDGVMER